MDKWFSIYIDDYPVNTRVVISNPDRVCWFSFRIWMKNWHQVFNFKHHLWCVWDLYFVIWWGTFRFEFSLESNISKLEVKFTFAWEKPVWIEIHENVNALPEPILSLLPVKRKKIQREFFQTRLMLRWNVEKRIKDNSSGIFDICQIIEWINKNFVPIVNSE